MHIGETPIRYTVTLFHYLTLPMYNKIFTKILDSSIWLESNPTRIIWFTFLAAMDEHGFAQFASVANLAYRARVDLPEAEKAVECLSSPDPNSSDPENEGRRIERVNGGWMVLNCEKYRALVTRAIAQEKNRDRVARFRAKRNADVMPSNAPVTPPNVSVTPSEALAETNAETDRKQVPAPPLPFSSSEFLTAWQSWLAYRKERKLPAYKLRSVQAQMAQLLEWGEPAAIQAINDSIRNQWQGLFQPKPDGQTTGKRTPGPTWRD